MSAMTIETIALIDIVAKVGSAIIGLFALFFILVQLRHIRRQLRDNATDSTHEFLLAQHRFFIEYPRFKPYFYSNKSLEEVTPEDRDRLLSIAEMMVDTFHALYQQRGSLEETAFRTKGAYMREIYSKSPILREYLEPLKNWYSSDFIEYLSSRPQERKEPVSETNGD